MELPIVIGCEHLIQPVIQFIRLMGVPTLDRPSKTLR
jgi:hypothetical protein